MAEKTCIGRVLNKDFFWTFMKTFHRIVSKISFHNNKLVDYAEKHRSYIQKDVIQQSYTVQEIITLISELT
jgi:hypothetical protein